MFLDSSLGCSIPFCSFELFMHVQVFLAVAFGEHGHLHRVISSIMHARYQCIYNIHPDTIPPTHDHILVSRLLFSLP